MPIEYEMYPQELIRTDYTEIPLSELSQHLPKPRLLETSTNLIETSKNLYDKFKNLYKRDPSTASLLFSYHLYGYLVGTLTEGFVYSHMLGLTPTRFYELDLPELAHYAYQNSPQTLIAFAGFKAFGGLARYGMTTLIGRHYGTDISTVRRLAAIPTPFVEEIASAYLLKDSAHRVTHSWVSKITDRFKK